MKKSSVWKVIKGLNPFRHMCSYAEYGKLWDQLMGDLARNGMFIGCLINERVVNNGIPSTISTYGIVDMEDKPTDKNLLVQMYSGDHPGIFDFSIKMSRKEQ